MKMFAYGNFDPLTAADRERIQNDRYQKQATKNILLGAKYPNLYSWDGKILIGTELDWDIAYPMLHDDDINELRDLDDVPRDHRCNGIFLEPLMLVRDIRGVIQTYHRLIEKGEL